ncbi:type II toxin-antitoxin system PemK/MazF family toxin [Chamaesiphon sp. VAR_48_metabat_135_sub]|uniref:type II toxin-antitoxin system PemK/MazF family toxin n=1 Tax=Chamaesiphon sp. VAR_48_metabat_135_sub TaxID=2964699 RepID=UPI00286A900A|nr:type II toxin-antitoxin system PemK/MazF family toxin [Chamaesiphon sp. VAR_48_metabat_135_sub]
MVVKYIPARGDIIRLNFDPTLGREQAGYRPALIITAREFNQATRLALVCPITSKVKGFNLEVILPEGLITSGVVLTFQVKTIDWFERQVKYVESLPTETMDEVIAKLQAMIT